MYPVDNRILKFIKRHHVMTLATSDNTGELYCANLFYSYIAEDNLFVFTTDTDTRHGSDMCKNSSVAASIVLETRTVGKVQGLQLQGHAATINSENADKARSSYIKRFPYAAATPLTLWVLHPTFMKFTDNTLGFGKKLIWHEK